MKKIFLSASLLALAGGLQIKAQDIYTVEQISAQDLNGDARYIGMGGAMSALGANISAMSTNPAGIGLYRRGDFSITGSILGEPGRSYDANYLKSSKTKASIDQLGFVYTMPIFDRSLKFVNLGFNYRKSRNSTKLIALNDIALPGGMSQGQQLRDLAYTNSNGWLDLSTSEGRSLTSPIANLGYDTFIIDPIVDPATKKITGYNNSYATAYHYGRAQWGSKQEFDFNLAFNFSEQFYLGVNIGAYNISGGSTMQYEEASVDEKGQPFMTANGQRKTYLLQRENRFSGTGVDAKFGFIVRPFVESPFRLGVSVTTPTYYAMSSSTDLGISSPYEHTDKNGNKFEYTEANLTNNHDYRLRTPWKVNFSLATTIGDRIALGAEYEIADHTSAQVRHLQNDYYYDDSFSSGTLDRSMQQMIDGYLRDTHTLRLGMEARLSRNVFGRLGYNYVSAPFKKEALLNLFTTSPSYQNATGTDYVNLGATNRITAGLGYRNSNFYADLAYQYQTQSATFYPFALQNGSIGASDRNDVPGHDLNLDRHQLSLTLGMRF